MVRDGRLPALRFPVRTRREDLDTRVEHCRIKPGELAHLSAYARGTKFAGDPPTARRARPIAASGPEPPAYGQNSLTCGGVGSDRTRSGFQQSTFRFCQAARVGNARSTPQRS
jgi:hypothetical protein